MILLLKFEYSRQDAGHHQMKVSCPLHFSWTASKAGLQNVFSREARNCPACELVNDYGVSWRSRVSVAEALEVVRENKSNAPF
jgi:hypothetical protein